MLNPSNYNSLKEYHSEFAKLINWSAPRSLLLKNINSGKYGVLKPELVGPGDAKIDRAVEFMSQAREAARFGKIIDIGPLDLAQSQKTATNGERMLREGLIQHPFEGPWWTLASLVLPDFGGPLKMCAIAERGEGGFEVALVMPLKSQAGIVCLGHMFCPLEDRPVEILFDPGILGLELDSENTVDGRENFLRTYNELAVQFVLSSIAISNTRGIAHERKPAKKKKREVVVPSYHAFATKEYFTAIGGSRKEGNGTSSGTRAPTAPHLRRGHVRNLPNGKSIWIQDMLVNVKSEGDLAFVETRSAYRVTQEQISLASDPQEGPQHSTGPGLKG